MCDRRQKGIHQLRDIKDEVLTDAIATAFEFSKQNIILKRIVVIQFVIIAFLIAFIICR